MMLIGFVASWESQAVVSLANARAQFRSLKAAEIKKEKPPTGGFSHSRR